MSTQNPYERGTSASQASSRWSDRIGTGSTGGAIFARMARLLFTGAVIGIMAIVFSISFAAIIYTGDMAQYLGHGIGLTLVGASVMAVAGAFCLSYRGTIVQPQDMTALILSSAVASIVSGWAGGIADSLFATAAVLLAVTTAITGAFTFAFGHLGLGFIVRFIPRPVLGGFLASTGYLLLTGAIGMALGEKVTVQTAAILFEPGNPERWLPWLFAGLLISVISHYIRHNLVLPGCIAAAAVAFYLVLWLTGTSLETARSLGLLLGPFTSTNLLAGLDPWIVSRADWGAVFEQLPSILAVVGMATIGSLLHASALEIATGHDLDPNKELRGIGIANMLASLGGGLAGYHLLSQTFFARAMGMSGRFAGIAVAVVSAVTVFLGAGYLSVLPKGVFASVIAFLSLQLLHTWLWAEGRRLPARDFAIVLLILAVAATIGFLQAIAVGLLAASLQFVIAYSKTNVVRLKTTVATMHSRVERSVDDRKRLSRDGHKARVYELAGYLFFGTASQLLAQLSAAATSGTSRPQFILIDFKRVQGIDVSAAFALGKLYKMCGKNGIELIFSGLSKKLEDLLQRSAAGPNGEGPWIIDRLDDALQVVEERLLAAAPADEAPASEHAGFLGELKRLHPETDLESYFEDVSAKAGEIVVEQGASSNSIVVLLAGSLRVEQGEPGGPLTSVARILPGALVGEIGLYAGTSRTAHIVAETECRLKRISLDTLNRIANDNPRLVADFHRLAASLIARRLIRTMSLLRDADI